MAAYIAFVATLNLCVGYALGVYIGVMPGFTPRRERNDDQEEPIGLPEVGAESAPEVEAETEVAAPTPEPPAAKPPAAEVAEAVEPIEAPLSEESPKAADTAQILEGLAIFKQKLDVVSEKLAESKEDREAVDQAADEMKQANDEYLDQTSEAVETLNSGSQDELSAEEENMRQMLNKQTEEIRRTNEEIDELKAEDDTETVREKLIQSSEQLVESATQLEESVPGIAKSDDFAADAQADDKSLPEEALARLEAMMSSIDKAIDTEDNSQPLQVATLSLEFEGDGASEHSWALLDSVQAMVTKELAPGQKVNATPEGRLLVTLSGDDVAEANERCERLRQQVKETTFCRDNQQVSASLVCSLADTKGAQDRQVVLARLSECHDEAKKLGESRTFHHDGALAAPVPPLQLSVAPQKVEF